jgi:sulfur carrier protein
MRVFVNGEPRDVPERTTVAALVREAAAGGADGRGIAVAVDAEVVPRGEWDSTALADGQRVEVLGAIQGG